MWRKGGLALVAIVVLFGLASMGATIVINPGEDIHAAINGAAVGDTI